MKKLAPWLIPLVALPALIAVTEMSSLEPGWKIGIIVVLAVLTLGAAVGTLIVYARESRAARQRRQDGGRSASGSRTDANG